MMQLKVIKQNANRIVSFNIIIKMQNANRMKPINVTKQSDLLPKNTQSNNVQIVNSNIKRPNKNLLEKYSFQDNDMSKSQEDISKIDDIYPLTKQNDNDWLQLSVKQITLFSRQLIVIFLYFIRQTFYLQIQYTIIYNQTPNQQIITSEQKNKTQTKNNKNQLNEKNSLKQNNLQNYKQVRNVRSKLVHGSILQNEGKHLILSLKAKNIPFLANTKHANQGLKLLKLSEVQFSLIRVYQTSKQGKMLCCQVIPNPIVNKEYSIDFWQEKSDQTQKNKPIGTMLFELFSAITEEPLAKKMYQQEQQSQYYIGDDSQIPQDIFQHKNSARPVGYNYTLGVPRKQQKQNSRNVFDNQSDEEDVSQAQPNSQRSRPNNQSQSKNQQFKYQSEVSQTKQNVLVFKLNEISRILDNNISKQKNQGYLQREYLAQTTQFLDETNGNKNSRSKDIKKVNTNNNNTSNINDTQLSTTKQKHVVKTQNDYTYVENDTQSRFQGNTTTNQREHYLSTLQYSKYVNQDIVLKGSPQISPIMPSTPTNFKKTSQNKVKQFSTSKTKKIQQNKKDSQQKVSKPQQNTSTNNKKQSKKVSPYSQRVQNDQEDISQDNSQWLLKNLPDMDSSNIRYKFDDNDISNIEETKNMQQLINQIQKIEKQWYQKRVLNRQLSNSKLKNENCENKNKNNKDIQEKKMRNQSRLENKNDCIDLELRKFRIKLDENTFYNKLIENLKNKHKINQSRSQIDQKKTQVSQNNKKEQSNINLPKDYIVYLIAHEVNEQQMSSHSGEISQKIHIKIPSQQIQDLIRTEKSQSQQNSHIKDQRISPKQNTNEIPNITSQNIRKKIIKDFQQQLFSKVMKIKLINPKQKSKENNSVLEKQKQKENNKIPQKKKTKIIEITLQQEYSLVSRQLDVLQKQKNQDPNRKNEKDLKKSNINENRISLIGMYPLPVMKPQKKGQQTSFYQNIPNQPLSITMYNMKTGNQQGRLCFQLKRGKIDKEIQTFESLDDLSGNYIVQNRIQSQLKSSNNIPAVKIQEKEKSLKSNSNKVETSQYNVNKEPKVNKEKQLKIDVNFQNNNKHQNPNSFLKNEKSNDPQVNNENQVLVNNQPKKKQNQPQKGQKQSQQNKNFKLALNGPQINKSNNQNNQFQIHTNNPQLPKDFNIDIRSNNIKSRSDKEKQDYQRLDSPHAGKIIKNNGIQKSPKREKTQPIRSQQGRMNKLNLQSNPGKNGFTQKLDIISVNLPQSQRLLPFIIPFINTTEQQREFQSPTQLKRSKDKTSNNSNRIKTQEKPRIHINSKNKTYEDGKQQGSSSYRLMKKQLQETAGLLQNLKMKAQDFINKVERQKRSETKNSRLDQTQSVNQKPNKLNNYQNDKSQIDKKQFSERSRKASHLQVRSSVISETVLSNKNNKKIDKIYINSKLMAANNQNKINRDRRNDVDDDLDGEEETPYITKKNSGNSKMLKDRIKRSIKLKQAGDYQFDILSYDANKGHDPRQNNQTPIKDLHISHGNKGLLSVQFYSMKIKFLQVNNPLNKKSQSSKFNNSKDYFVMICSDLNKNNQRSRSSLLSQNQPAPFIQRCYESPQLNDENLYVQFPLTKSKSSQTRPTLFLQGKQSSHIIIQLHDSLQQHLQQEMKRNYQSYLSHDQHPIDLVTSSPKNQLNSQPIGTLSVTFLQLMAQDSFQFKTENDLQHKKSTIINYSNFLYSGEKIIGKININYTVNSQPKNDNEIHKKRNSYEQPHIFLNLHNSLPKQNFTSVYQNHNPSQKHSFNKKHETINQNMSNLSTSKNTNQFKFKNSLLARYNENLSLFQRDHDEIRKLRSQSGMTKKVSPRRKKMRPNKIQQTQKHSEESRLVDPLQILKRRGPKPLKSQQKIKSHSQSHHVRLSRPFQTPMNKRAKNQFDSLNSSQSLHFNRQKTTENHSHVKNSGISSNHVQIHPRNFLQTSQGSQQQQIISHKKDRSSQIRRKKNTKDLKNYNIQSRIYPTEQTRLSQMRRYDGGNIKFGKSSRFNIVDSPQNPVNSEKAYFPGPGHYELRSIFQRHKIKQP